MTKWEEEKEAVFISIKRALKEVVQLNHPNPERRYYVRTDASGYTTGSCLYQLDDQQHVCIVAFFSRLLRGPELRYTVTEKEALAIVASLKQFRLILLGHNITIITDHNTCFLKTRSSP